MPLTVRHVQPKHLYRKPLPNGVKNELQAVAVYSLAGAIRQISSLAKHAESMLGELCDTMADINTRTLLLDSRITRLQDDIIPNLDVDEEAEISLMDYLEVEPFKSDRVIHQQLLSIQSGPEALTNQYQSCDPKPDLNQFTPLFNNGCNAMSLYSNPEFFFIAWRKSMEREAIRMKITEQSASTEIVSVNAISSKPKRPRQRSASHSSTLPTRGKSRERSVPTAMQAFSSVRDKKNQKRRSVIKDDTFHHANYERSESSGYLSHNSSSTSLDPDGTGSIGSHEGRFLTSTPPGHHPPSGLHVSTSEHALIGGQAQAISTISDNGLLGDAVDGVSSNQQVGVPNGRPVMLNEKLSGSETSNKMSSSQGSLTSVDSGSGRPKVLHKMARSSSRTEKRDKTWEQQMMESAKDTNASFSSQKGSVHVASLTGSPTKSPRTRRESMPVSPSNSPRTRRGSMPGSPSISPRTRPKSIHVPVNPTKSPRMRRETMPVSLVSPGASPEIKRRAELLVEKSPDMPHQRPHSGVFQFPDPLEVLNLSLNASSFQAGNDDQSKKVNGFSPDDFPPIDPQLVDKLSLNSPTKVPPLNKDIPSPVSPRRQRHQTVSGLPGGVIRRPAPSPPNKNKTPSSAAASLGGVTPDQPSVMLRPRQSRPSPHVSPITRRHSIQSIEEESPRTPKRKAPPPPTGNSSNKATDLDQMVKGSNKKGVVLERQRSSDILKPRPQRSPSTPTSILSGTSSSSQDAEKTPTNTPNHTPSHTPSQPPTLSSTPSRMKDQPRSLSMDQPTTKSESDEKSRDSSYSRATRAPSLTKAVLYNSLLDDFMPETGNENRMQRLKTSGGPYKSHDQPVTEKRTQDRLRSGNTSHMNRPREQPSTEKQAQRGAASGKKQEPPSPSPASVVPTQRMRPMSTSVDTQRHRPMSTSGDTPSTSSRFSESDKIADILRAKAKQRKQKSDDKKKKNTNQILMGAGVNTTVTEERSELLKSIRKGIQLKTVLDQQERVQKQSAAMPWDVAAILERRQALATPLSDEGDQSEAVLETEWDDM